MTDLELLERPTVIDVWAPHCAQCRRMRPDLDAVVAKYEGLVDHRSVNANEEPDVADQLGIMGTPTLIGVRDGAVVARTVGRRSADDLESFFAAVAGSGDDRHRSPAETRLRAVTGAALVAIGVIAGFVWPLILLGLALLGYVAWALRR